MDIYTVKIRGRWAPITFVGEAATAEIATRKAIRAARRYLRGDNSKVLNQLRTPLQITSVTLIGERDF